MDRRNLFQGSVAAGIVALFSRVAPVKAETEVAAKPLKWVALGNRWAYIEYQDDQPTITWTGRWNEDESEFIYDDWGAYLPGVKQGV